MTQSRDYQIFIDLLTELDDSRLMEKFLNDLLTPQEFEELATRWEIIKMLDAGHPQREIAKRLNVSIGTVSRGARQLKYGKRGFTELLSRLKSSE